MLKWKKIAKNSMLINAGKEYNEGPYDGTTFYYYEVLIVDRRCQHKAKESASFIEKMKLDDRIMMKEPTSRPETRSEKGAIH